MAKMKQEEYSADARELRTNLDILKACGGETKTERESL